MKNSKAVYSEIVASIRLNESEEEKEAIAGILMDYFFGADFSKIHGDKPITLTPEVDEKLKLSINRINEGQPVQYVTGFCDFLGKRFLVTPGVLIPRPETEELVVEVLRFVKVSKLSLPRILDIGTGSGCIPVTLATKLKGTFVATDISEDALRIAQQNALSHNVVIDYRKHDILHEPLPFSNLDVIVSNPPYIAKNEMSAMSVNVVNFEPHLALFVPDEDPLLFYRKIATQARSVLKQGGLLVFEINERFGNDVADLLKKNDFTDVKILKDLSGKERIVKGIQP